MIIIMFILSFFIFFIGTAIGISYMDIENLGIYLILVFFQIITLLKIKELKKDS